MKTINQSVEVAFRAVELKDAMIISPLMDRLRAAIVKNRKAFKYEELPREEREKYQRVWQEDFGGISAEKLEAMYNLLLKMGFCSTAEHDEISDDELVLAEKKSN